jgi:dipeptidyl aminopeptidase/acylaminoacyl peptidase
MGEQTGDDLHDWIAAAEFLRQLPTIDPDRVAIMGASWGGYATLISLGRAPGAFQAGVALAAPSHWFSYWEETRTSWTRRFRIKLMGAPAQNIERYRRQSAQEYAASYQSPVLILHGQDDPGVPVGQAIGIAQALARHDKPHELKTYPGEGHSFRKPEAMIDSARRIEAFLNEHL